MDLSNFLNPAEETIQEGIQDSEGDIVLQEVIEQYIHSPNEGQDDDDGEELRLPVVHSTQAVLQALQVLIDFMETGNSGIREPAVTLRSLEHIERELVVKKANEGIQGTLDVWLM
ncbi:hypothetical protein VC83_02163 [Pseudogymnoascus destructans]|uniref:Uncharacterized protein n=2 Tax=Pseudogymnoascus destructans TaxID=655981 RepID=L8FXG9_PSED2|nr:uncharacterized protein VC83_02163 [Pseudogymnoascus destructans]ELR04411.1 hypothetical protein GMDG_01487 [Pseudogymnoascus destructans 20631-21]OAF61301.1 hypothetical protein VC83_02163 [Pseudogymnoascus destructans]